MINKKEKFTIIGLGLAGFCAAKSRLTKRLRLVLGYDFFSETPISVIAGYTLSQPYFYTTLYSNTVYGKLVARHRLRSKSAFYNFTFYIFINTQFKLERGVLL